ncbi:hypothetical protein GCM10023149_21940 [Mucilaginibacter gynuensis]|uniref:Uncharacterized protein n=1 Tax=Mucilaginibacter gynuensis TaxID=1302236 RepID=A0ABP8GCR9_9SPHI
MVIVKIGEGTMQARQIEIVTERGIWDSGVYKLFNSGFLPEDGTDKKPEPTDENNPDFLGTINLNKENATWAYSGKHLSSEEQKEIADFIMDYQVPDSVY